MRIRPEGQSYPYEFDLVQVLLKSTIVDKTLDLVSVVGELSIFENMFTNTMTGNIYVQEQLNLISNFPIVGHEKLEIVLRNPRKKDEELRMEFRIYSVSNITTPNQSTQTYMINFISEEYTTNLKSSISRSFSNSVISDIVKSICTTDLSIEKKIDIEKTKNVHDIIIPNLKPLDAINWLAKRAIAEQYEGANYLFFETREGFKFRSLESLMSLGSQQTYERIMTDGELESDDTRNVVRTLRKESTFNLLKNIPSGMYANRLVIHDMIQRKTETLDYNYAESFAKQQHLENGKGDWKIDDFKTINGQETTMFVEETVDEYNTSPLSKQFFMSRFDDKNTYNEKAIQNRVSQMQQAQDVKLIVTIAGDIRRNVGDVIEIDMDSVQFGDGDEVKDKLYSGKYLVSSLRHLIKDDRYTMVMEVIKDSYFKSLPKGK